MITHGRGYLFGLEDDNSKYYIEQKPDILKVAEELAGESDE
jgi:hypothetical protein